MHYLYRAMKSCQEILKTYWGFDQFRPLQEDIIQSVIAGCDTLALLPTGGGKSICYQVPGMQMEGICLVISPLIALMKDQVENLNKRGIKAMAIYSGMTRKEIDIKLDNCVYGDYKFLYLSPERLETDLFKERVQRMNVNLIAVDEAHCISQWGYDFRPSYLTIAELRLLLPAVPMLALTATATEHVRKDIVAHLEFKQEQVFVQSFERDNLAYIVQKEDNKLDRILKILRKVQGSGIIYSRNRRKTKELSDFLNRNEIKADFYHAGLDQKTRNQRQEDWMTNKTRIIVSTNAFGMGIDKPDVRVVIHDEFTDSLEAYYQEAGRAGRDGQKAYAVLLYNESDKLTSAERIKKNTIDLAQVKAVYQALSSYLQLAPGAGQGASFTFDLATFCESYRMHASEVYLALKELEREGHIAVSESVFMPSRIHFVMKGKELYEFCLQQARLDPIIKMLLRSYEGIFDTYCTLRESELAKRLEVPLQEVTRQLKYLNDIGIVSYYPEMESSVVTYLLPRADARYLKIDAAGLKQRNQAMQERLNAVVNYATAGNMCRSRMLLAYFNEDKEAPCGQCDYCIAMRKKQHDEHDFDTVKNRIIEILRQKNQTLAEVVKQCEPHSETESISAIRWLMDKGAIQHAEHNKLALADKSV